MKVFVTGATGVIGRRVLPLLRRADHEVTAVARSPQKSAAVARAGANAVSLDLFDANAVRWAVAGHDAVINLATHIPDSTAKMLVPWAWRENDRIRREASVALVEASISAGVTCFVQESFAPVYPDRADEWIDERVPIQPVRYNQSVASAEAAAASFSGGGRQGIVLRFGAFYGPDALQTIELMRWVKKGFAPLPGPELAYLSSVAHDDAASAVAAALALPGGIYNVVDDEPLTHRELVDSLAQALGVGAPKLPPRWMTPLFGVAGQVASRSQRISNRKLRAASDWSPRYHSARDGWKVIASRELEPAHAT
jgi:nucleoside-diphosphate-sugar epimerase